MRFLLCGVWVVALLLALGAVIVFREAARKVKRESAYAKVPLYARNVGSFYEASNRFPQTPTELAEYVFGQTNWTTEYTFAVVDDSKKAFSIGAIMGLGSTAQIQFQLSATGIVQQSSSHP